MASVFLSYDRDDAATARHIAAALEKAGHNVWWDKHISGGSQYAKEIEQALNGSDVVVVLWTPSSIESPWVRDEAGAGRDRSRLVPLSLDATLPPLGFRQFQSIDLGTWSGRGKTPRLKEILAAIEQQAERDGRPDAIASPSVGQALPPPRKRPSWLRPALVAAVGVSLAGLGTWLWSGHGGLPTVKVTAADSSARSQAAASDLLVKLGGLAQLGEGKWQLLDSTSPSGRSDLLFRTADTGSDAKPQSDLVLLDGKSNSLLWSREFNFAAGQQTDLRRQVSLAAGRVLNCALESRNAGNLPRDQLKLFLDVCASFSDLGFEDYGQVAGPLRSILGQNPRFKPAWGRLIIADSALADLARYSSAEESQLRQLKTDAARAKAIYPDMPEIAIAETRFFAPTDFGGRIHLLDEAARRAPDNVEILTALNHALQGVGRMADATETARQAAALDLLSPGGRTDYILTLAYGGDVETARAELAKAEKVWAGTGALNDGEIAFVSRYGDPALALKLDPRGYATRSYYTARADPSSANIAKLKAAIDDFRPKQVTPDQVGWAIQGLSEFGLVDDVFYWVGRLSSDQAARISHILFRPALAAVRRDPRFMSFASRIGLVSYWRSSGIWPDYCARPGIPYDCKAAAAKLK